MKKAGANLTLSYGQNPMATVLYSFHTPPFHAIRWPAIHNEKRSLAANTYSGPKATGTRAGRVKGGKKHGDPPSLAD